MTALLIALAVYAVVASGHAVYHAVERASGVNGFHNARESGRNSWNCTRTDTYAARVKKHNRGLMLAPVWFVPLALAAVSYLRAAKARRIEALKFAEGGK